MHSPDAFSVLQPRIHTICSSSLRLLSDICQSVNERLKDKRKFDFSYGLRQIMLAKLVPRLYLSSVAAGDFETRLIEVAQTRWLLIFLILFFRYNISYQKHLILYTKT